MKQTIPILIDILWYEIINFLFFYRTYMTIDNNYSKILAWFMTL